MTVPKHWGEKVEQEPVSRAQPLNFLPLGSLPPLSPAWVFSLTLSQARPHSLLVSVSGSEGQRSQRGCRSAGQSSAAKPRCCYRKGLGLGLQDELAPCGQAARPLPNAWAFSAPGSLGLLTEQLAVPQQSGDGPGEGKTLD